MAESFFFCYSVGNRRRWESNSACGLRVAEVAGQGGHALKPRVEAWSCPGLVDRGEAFLE